MRRLTRILATLAVLLGVFGAAVAWTPSLQDAIVRRMAAPG